jgi:hypothetical protein
VHTCSTPPPACKYIHVYSLPFSTPRRTRQHHQHRYSASLSATRAIKLPSCTPRYVAPIMCLMSVREEEAPIPARVVRTRRVVRRSPSPPREVRVTRQSFVEERRPSPPSPTRPEPEPEPRVSTTIRTEQRTEQRRVSRPPSVAPSRSAPTHFVEVDHDSSSSEEDVRSRTTRKSSRSKSSRSKPRTDPPASEYSIHEREVRRERGYSNPPPKPEYGTYRYVEAPKNRSGSRSGYHEGSRVSRDSFRREDDYGRRYHR